MITAVDSSVLFDVLTADPKHAATSLAALREARTQGMLMACPVVWAEVRSFFVDAGIMTRAFLEASIGFDPFERACSDLAGEAWGLYRKQGGARTRLLADFLIGAHATTRGGRLLSRDRGFYRRYFRGLQIIDPGSL